MIHLKLGWFLEETEKNMIRKGLKREFHVNVWFWISTRKERKAHIRCFWIFGPMGTYLARVRAAGDIKYFY